MLLQPLALLEGGLLQPLALLEWEPTLIQDQGLLQPLALLDWEPTLIVAGEGLLQPLALLERGCCSRWRCWIGVGHHVQTGWMRCIHSAPLRALPACAAPFCAWHQEALEKTPWVAAQLEDRMAKREDLVGWLATVSPQEALATAAP